MSGVLDEWPGAASDDDPLLEASGHGDPQRIKARGQRNRSTTAARRPS
jgi:hypothetical protein